MIHYYYIIILIITGLLSSLVTLYLPALKQRYKRIKTRPKRKSHIDVIHEFEYRIHNLEAKMANREKNMKSRIHMEVTKQLKEIIND